MNDKKLGMSFHQTLLACIALFAVSGVCLWLIFSNQPVAQKEGATKVTPMLVEVISAEVSNYQPTIHALGEVMPESEALVTAQVAGLISAMGESFELGRRLNAGTVLVQVEPSDYELRLAEAEAELADAKARFAIEQGEQLRAEKSVAMLGKPIAEANRSLALREPQKQQAQAVVTVAESRVRAAQLALQRTKVTMPFDGQVVERLVSVGSLVSESQPIARVIGTDRHWVQASVSLKQLAWLADPQNQPSVQITNPTHWPQGSARSGTLKQTIDELDSTTRMARVLVEVEDPLGLKQTEWSNRPVVVGSYLELALPVKPLKQVVRLDLAYLRKNDQVWVMHDKKLDIRPVSVIFRDKQFAYINQGIKPGDKIVISDLARIKQDAPLRLKAVAEKETNSAVSVSTVNPQGSSQ
ncbi:efflux RND transporter periplasmic adaptor subunit [Pleionea litopenaei]|uniref:Efflux RND transporter periplasmic adaptor subunit n=1 Tax=Pleionea litopenaei TaxID=3070815 RepID=A0AA51RW99_9GAMM|nr:efflux RND transporter periplasmic adaptor subunit [Pleionea sp. HL-JVS1]WMS88956.1 efflux RND transporter periplasmic adaptor subunit [Pleionea sp. HL-JVS1]